VEDVQANEKSSAKRIMIKDLSNQDIGNSVQVVGYINEITDPTSFLLTDKTGELMVENENKKLPYKKDDLINVYAMVEPTMEGELKLKSQFIQNMSGLNFENYTKIYELKKDLI
jgi:uncharacterized protein YdeI (BOF family)